MLRLTRSCGEADCSTAVETEAGRLESRPPGCVKQDKPFSEFVIDAMIRSSMLFSAEMRVSLPGNIRQVSGTL